MARDATSPSGRDTRSVARQLEEDDDVIVLNPGRATGADHGGGVTNFLNDDVGLGLSDASIPAAQPINPRKVVNFEDVSDPDPSDRDSNASAVPSARADTVEEEEVDDAAPSARTDVACST